VDGQEVQEPPENQRFRKRTLDVVRLALVAGLGVACVVALAPGSAHAHAAKGAGAALPTTIITKPLLLPFEVSVTVTGSGSVTSSPSGIDCGTTCSASFIRGTSVTLSAASSSGLFEFGGWGGACSGTGTCTVSSAATVTASFHIRAIIATIPFTTISVPTTYALTVAASGSGTVTSTPSGINCPSTCTASYTVGTSVDLHANPASGFRVGSWSGLTCTGTGSDCTVAAGGTVTVTFSAIPTSTSTSTSASTSTQTPTTTTTLPVIIAPSPTTTAFIPPNIVTFAVAVTGSGTITGKAVGAADRITCGATGSVCFGSYKPGTTVTLHAGAAKGFQFSSWSGGGCSGHAAVCVVKVEKAASVKAKFTPVPNAPIVPIEINAAAFSVSWSASVGSGKLLVHGRIAKSAQVEVQLRRSGGSKLVTEHLSLPAGPFSLTLKLDSGLQLLPGGFVITIDGKSGNLSVPPQVKTLSLVSPPEGVVDRAFASSSAGGHPSATLRHVKEAFVHFEFQSQPRAGKPLTVSWFQPNGKLLGTAAKSPGTDVTSSIKSGSNLPVGAWHVDLRSGSTLVKRVTIQIQ
jgi:cell division septation protein DedD